MIKMRLPVQQLARSSVWAGHQRPLSAAAGQEKLVSLDHCKETQIATIRMHKSPVNAYCRQFAEQLAAAIRQAEHGGESKVEKELIIIHG